MNFNKVISAKSVEMIAWNVIQGQTNAHNATLIRCYQMVNASVMMVTLWILTKIHVWNVAQPVRLAKTHSNVWLVLKDQYLVKLFASLVGQPNTFQQMNARLVARIV